MNALDPKAALSYLTGLKLTRYGLVFGSGVLCGSWLGQQYPDQSAAFWAMPSTSLVMAIVGLWLSQRKTAENKEAAAVAVETALYSAPPGMTLIEASKAEPLK
jgi:predicted MFS family arabinose efflux permease